MVERVTRHANAQERIIDWHFTSHVTGQLEGQNTRKL
jgi:hypothetical protein